MAVEQTTERINRHQLVRLLDTMSSLERQAITQRTLVSDVEAAVSATPPSGPRHPRPASHVAAMLPPVKPMRPRAVASIVPVVAAAPTLPPSAPPPVDEDAAIVLSPHVLAELTSEEIAMLPPRFQPVARALELVAPPRIEIAARPRPWIALMLGAVLAVALVVLFVVHAPY